MDSSRKPSARTQSGDEQDFVKHLRKRPNYIKHLFSKFLILSWQKMLIQSEGARSWYSPSLNTILEYLKKDLFKDNF